ncbi:MAG: membrane protein insertase YidC [Pseudomonadota bacterium]
MDNRLLLWASLGLIFLMTYQAWQRDYGPPPAAASAQSVEEAATSSELPAALPPATQTPSATPASTLPSAPEVSAQVAQPVIGDRALPPVRVITDVYELLIDPAGAQLYDVRLRGYPVQKDQPDVLVSLLSKQPAELDLIQTGLVRTDKGAAPNHEKVFAAERAEYQMSDGSDTLVVPLTWTDASGLRATKTFTFTRGRFDIAVALTVDNGTSQPVSAAPYVQVQRQYTPPKRSMFNVDSYSFVGSVIFNGEGTEKLKHKDLQKEPLNFQTADGWIATIEHHFVSAVVPTPGALSRYSSRVGADGRELISAVMPTRTINPGGQDTFTHTVFVGPKLQSQLEEVAPGLVRTVDYGILSVLSQPLFWILDRIHSLVGNWGLAIILMTILVKLAFYPLAEKSGRSMAKMRKLAPRLKTIQERYKDDRQAQSREMMNLYKNEGVNPMASCLPLLLQMPVFLALYWVLIESVELRQAPFALWIDDLSSRDPLFILPLIMAGAMFIQTKLNPPPADPTTAKVMTIMPLMMSVFFAFFPAGLVLYWVVNTVLSVLQQWRINRVVGAG